MQILAVLLAAFVASTAANPIIGPHCDLAPFLNCTGGLEQEANCQENFSWKCTVSGVAPDTSDATCAAQCVCEIPCP
ncbi:hypothetical protein FB45DRAFT_121576 [Roridomyces roridus]|uniref:Uncharacterized protein n=1 Tax=Roridomyces roridus TaxID=1738132 RepID=A0AAD7BIH5_9AGAR|nr:hypothetical protein FB45DRAFT_121576 [Roridomyces roridus]